MTTNTPLSLVALTESLWDDPFYRSITEDCARDNILRRRILTSYFEYSLEEAARIGRRVFTENASEGAAAWILPASDGVATMESRQKASYLRELLGDCGYQNYRNIVDFMSPIANDAGLQGDWYLSIVGVPPSAQGRGIGALLLSPTISEADEVGAYCYLETFTPRNTRFYERLGFKTISIHNEPVTGASYAIMRRAPSDPHRRTVAA
jgi:GNAT superfamily N-acetyltransferase